jgi:hypothetical protein
MQALNPFDGADYCSLRQLFAEDGVLINSA